MKKISFFMQLVLIMFVISAVPAISVIYANSVKLRKVTEDMIAESALNKIRANKELGDEILTNIIYNALDLILAKRYYELNGILSYEVLNSDYNYVSAALRMNSSLSGLADRNQLVHSIFYYMDDADYIISTDAGFVRLENYESLEWMEAAILKIRGTEGIWYPRIIPADNMSREDTNIVSYVYRSSSLYTSAKVTIVINVYEKELSSLICSGPGESNVEGFLLNGQGDVIAHSDPHKLYENIGAIEYVETILHSKKKNGYGVTNDNDLLYTYEKSALYDWLYVNVYSLDQIYYRSDQIIRAGLGMTLLIILVGAFCAVLFSFGIYRPIRKLRDEIRNLDAGSNDRSRTKNEIVYLSGAFSEIRKKNLSLKESLSESEVSVRRNAINNLFHGESLKEKERDILVSFFPHNHFMVCMISMDDFVRYQNNTTHEERKHHREIIYEQLKNAVPANYSMDSVRYNMSSIALLLNIKDYDSDQVKELVKSCMQLMQNNYYKITKESLSVGVSQVHRYFEGVKICMDEACEALKQRIINGRNQVFFYQRPKNQLIFEGYPYEKRIMNNLEIGDTDKVKLELGNLVTHMKSQDYIPVDNVMLVFNQLIGAILIYITLSEYNIAEILGGSQSNLYASLAEIETIDEIENFLAMVYAKIIAYQNGAVDEQQDHVKTILRYIRKNYKNDIDFENLAKEIGISYSYARKIVKEKTGKSIIDNLNLVRIEKAKALLENESLSIAEISAAVGYHNIQSLYRFFNKFEGVPPRNYKPAAMNTKD